VILSLLAAAYLKIGASGSLSFFPCTQVLVAYSMAASLSSREYEFWCNAKPSRLELSKSLFTIQATLNCRTRPFLYAKLESHQRAT
jgi:hypothetical protein